MKIIHTTSSLKRELDALRASGKTIGFVPTMGALHRGHISLVSKCAEANDACVASIFVNPNQFNDPSDFDLYPRNAKADCELLEESGCAIAFIPAVAEIYPTPDARVFNLGSLAEVMEGACRPGHFNGVAQVITRLFDIVGECRAYFGLKDYQQLAVIASLVRRLSLPVKLVACPTVREPDGLAMSSRNMRLSPAERSAAPVIYRTLEQSRSLAPSRSVHEVAAFVCACLSKEPLIKTEYFSIVHPETLRPITSWREAALAVGCIAAFCGSVRLIDNITYNY
ncbi:MAG: pantoate--beta-alanine ligase [Tannerellaceae bacterium]|jgi:pantoate--beta-alanine ligase|nr:pantoate--beta-alanine ligase [Tannerellaceae bacterium]